MNNTIKAFNGFVSARLVKVGMEVLHGGHRSYIVAEAPVYCPVMRTWSVTCTREGAEGKFLLPATACSFPPATFV